MIIINPYLRFVLSNSNMMFLIHNKSIFFPIKFLNNPTLDNIRRCKWALRKKEPNMKDRRNIRKENKRLQPRCTSVYLSQASTKDPCLLLRCILSQDPLPPSLVCPPLTAFLSHPCTCSISALLNHEDPRNELLFSADRSAHRTLFREKGSRGEGPEGGPVSNSFFWRLHFVRQREGKREKKRKEKKKYWRKLRSSCEKSLYLDGDPLENVPPVKKIGPWPAVGFRIIGKRGIWRGGRWRWAAVVEGEEVDERIEMGDVSGVLWARYYWILSLDK